MQLSEGQLQQRKSVFNDSSTSAELPIEHPICKRKISNSPVGNHQPRQKKKTRITQQVRREATKRERVVP